MPTTKKNKNVKVRDLKPKKDAKGGGAHFNPNHQTTNNPGVNRPAVDKGHAVN